MGAPCSSASWGRDQPQEACFREDGSHIHKPVLCISGGGLLRSILPEAPMIQGRVLCGCEGRL